MGFWDFFRKKKKAEPVVKAERLKLSELDSWVYKRKEELETKEKNLLKEIKTTLHGIISELGQEKDTLKQVNVDGKKAEEKIKFVVKENLEKYIYYLEKLLERLNSIDGDSREKAIGDINSAFSDFNKRSSMNYEKATFLIGKELGNIKETIRKFFRNLEKTLKDNQEIIDALKIINSVKGEIEKIEEIESVKIEIEKKNREYSKKTESIKKDVLFREQEIGKIKESKEFAEEEGKKRELQKKEEELEESVEGLRKIIDFKALANFYHSFEKEMRIVKNYKDNFKQSFQKTQGTDLLNLLAESKMQYNNILEKMKEIEEKEREIQEIIFQDLGILKLEKEIRELNANLEDINAKKTAEEKKASKLEENLKEIIGKIKGQLIKIDVEVE